MKAYEPIRGCGYRKVHGLYLVSPGMATACDRLPLPLTACECCGTIPRFNRSISRFNLSKYAGMHEPCICSPYCSICRPFPDDPPAFLMWVGKKYYTMESFHREAVSMGVSKRIPFIPVEFQLGRSWILFAYQDALETVTGISPRKVKKQDAIFLAVRPQRIEYLLWESEATPEELSRLIEQGITPIVIPNDGDAHKNSRKKDEESFGKELTDFWNNEVEENKEEE